MTTLPLAVRAFFRNNSIEHFGHGGVIKFPCPHCQMEAVMDEDTTSWACTTCNSQGTLLTLFQCPNFTEVKIKQGYNPERQRRDIQSAFLNAIRAGGMNDTRLHSLYEKTMTLIDHYRHD